MSHFKERKAKVCLNCNADLIGRFCHQCGQENREPRLSVWGLITHFFSDITHFDGKFFSTTGKLISRPGLLPKEYILGRRARYLDPIRMYIFTSAVFFLVFFSAYHVEDMQEGEKTAAVDAAAKDSVKKKTTFMDVGFTSRTQYDSAQQALPANKRDGWLKKRFILRTIELNKRVQDDEDQFWKDALTKFVHSFPYLLFVSLPLYAFFLKLLYIRRKKYYYVDHGLFLIFLYIFTFIFLLLFTGIDKLRMATDAGWMGFLEAAMLVWGLYYAWRAMRKFYEQRRFKTFLKFVLFNFMCLVSLVVLFAVFFLLTVFSI